jgi:predicted ATPase
VLNALPDTPERARQELLLQTTLGPALMVVKGYASPEVEHAYARARALCQQIGDTPQFFLVLRGLWWFYLLRAELQTARELGEQLLSLAQRAHDPALLLESRYALGNTLNYLGEFAAAQAHLEQGIALYDRQQHRTHALLYGQDPGVFCYSYAAVTLWLLGYPDQALQRNHEALTLAQEVAHPLSLAFALSCAALLHFSRREGPLVQARAEAIIALAAEHGFAHWWALGTMLQGWARAMQGQSEEGIPQLRQGLAAWQATGARGAGPYYLAMLAEAYGQAGQAEEGLHVLAEALALVHAGGERRHEAELYRLKGELLLSAAGGVQNAALSAEECFQQALAIARHQQARSLELRAAMSLSRLWQQQGKQAEARQLLAPIYGWFTEGFDTADLLEARALLDELG